ncbi:hypothetical protein EDB81DRAFT_894323 [Dactylonectria macrodidyma]|uniref:Uncharacterized protein n=1 Tax=Dactylonectria macrodidyma TaxID=307937 RepID=A0A9P9D381_9HYPO|nr:hypothetical protein EDB81DRAFT_894323 [Dactylonectria macrodidyma]
MIVGQDNDTPAWVPDDYYCSQLLPPIADPTGLRSVANGSGRSNIFSVPTAQGIGYLPSQDPFNWQFGAQAMVEDPTEPTLSISSLLATELDVTPMDQGTCGSQGPPNETPLRLIAGTIATDLVGVSATVDDRNLSSNSVDLSTLFAGYDSLGWVTTMADQYQQMALPEHLPGPSTSRRPDALTNQPELVFPFAPGELTAQDSSNPSLPTSIEAKLRLMLLGKGLSQESIAHFIGLLPDSVLVPSTSPRQSEHAISMEITRPGANCARCSMLKKAKPSSVYVMRTANAFVVAKRNFRLIYAQT